MLHKVKYHGSHSFALLGSGIQCPADCISGMHASEGLEEKIANGEGQGTRPVNSAQAGNPVLIISRAKPPKPGAVSLPRPVSSIKGDISKSVQRE